MRALIRRLMRWHREAARQHARAGRRRQAEREYETVRRLEPYLAAPPRPTRWRGQRQAP